MRRRTLLEKKGRVTIESKDAVAGDILFYHAAENKNIIVPFDSFTADLFPAPEYGAIGVVVVPGSHQVYSTKGACAVMSLNCMSQTTPDSGFNSLSGSGIFWGGSGYTPNTISGGLPIRDKVNYIGPSFNLQPVCYGNTNINNTFLPTDLNLDYIDSTNEDEKTVLNPYDENTAYKYLYIRENSDIYANYCLPSPYKTDGSRNSTYYTTDCGTNNALTDFDGEGNTKKLIELSTYQPNWKTDSSITNTNTSNHYPAACCCWRYHTLGTSQGDWYLPSLSELGYLVARYKKIGKIVRILNDTYYNYFASPWFYNQAKIGMSTRVGDSNNHYVLAIDVVNGGILMRIDAAEAIEHCAFMQFTTEASSAKPTIK